MKIYLLIMLIGSHSDRGSLHLGTETAVGNASAIGFSLRLVRDIERASHLYGVANGNLPFPAKISCTSLLGTPDSSLSIRPA